VAAPEGEVGVAARGAGHTSRGGKTVVGRTEEGNTGEQEAAQAAEAAKRGAARTAGAGARAAAEEGPERGPDRLLPPAVRNLPRPCQEVKRLRVGPARSSAAWPLQRPKGRPLAP